MVLSWVWSQDSAELGWFNFFWACWIKARQSWDTELKTSQYTHKI
jgi:hypothetical protein